MPDSFEKGDVVKLVDCHHNHNDGVKGHVGDKGEATKGPHRRTNKYLIHFLEGQSHDPLDRYWIDGSYLEKTQADA